MQEVWKNNAMGTKPSGKSVNADEFMPPSCDWEDPGEPLFTFSNGWTLRDAKTKHDQRLMTRATLTCVGGMRLYQGPPAEAPSEAEVEAKRAEMVAQYRPMYFKHEEHTGFNAEYAQLRLDTQVERQLRLFKNRVASAGSIKLLYIMDDENRPRCCVYMALVKGLEGKPGYDSVSYGSSRDLGQEHPVEVDGEMFHLVEARLGTGAHPPRVVEPLLVEWYTAATGKFDEAAYEAAVKKRRYYGAVGGATISESELATIRALKGNKEA